jgi:hypothetical protein
LNWHRLSGLGKSHSIAFAFAKVLRYSPGFILRVQGWTLGDFENILPDQIVKSTLWRGNELVLPYAEASRAIGIATENHIAVLGFEAFDVREDGLYTVDLSDPSGYIRFTGDWLAYVVAINAEAEQWISEHRYGTTHGYVLTSASKREFDHVKELRRTNRL